VFEECNADSLLGHLTMNDRIALASSLRIVSPVPDNVEVQVCKLTMAALLNEAHSPDPEDIEYSTFLGAVLGDANDTIKLKLSMLIPAALTPRDALANIVTV
jgi:hypothetical protein